jgi:hypothetical protein
MEKTDTQKIIDKIQKLFQLGKSPSRAEAESAIRKAEALMNEYDLSYGEVNYIVERVRVNNSRIHLWEEMLFNEICVANNCSPAISRGYGILGLAGRKINVFLSVEMFRYLMDTVKRVTKDKCRGKGRKYNSDFKTSMGLNLALRIQKYGSQVSWAADREAEINNICEYQKLPQDKSVSSFKVKYRAAYNAGNEAAQGVRLNKQTALNQTGLLEA